MIDVLDRAMSIQNHLAYSLNRKDQKPNKELASHIATEDDESTVEALVAFINSNPIKRARMDAILTLAYIAEENPNLMVSCLGFFVDKLGDPVNRVAWGSMIALSHLATLRKQEIFDSLPNIIDAMDRGSVVARDHGFKIMVTLYADDRFREDVFLLILEQLAKAPSNQLGQYAERLMSVLERKHVNRLIEVLEERKEDVVNESHIKRLHKNLKKLYEQL